MGVITAFISAHKIISIIILVVLLIIIYAYFRESPGKHIRKATKYHKKGELCYGYGNVDSANDYYGAAEYHREKAKELREV